MLKLPSPRLLRAAAGLAASCAFVAAPVAAHAANTNATGTLTPGGLTNTAPAITPFGVTLTGSTQTVNTKVGAWNVTDATGSNAGYSVTVADTIPTVDGTTGAAGTGSSLTLTPTTATAATGNPAAAGPVAAGAQLLSTTGVTIDNATAGTGQGEWDFAADGLASHLSIIIPGNASPGAYSSTLTFTTAPPVA